MNFNNLINNIITEAVGVINTTANKPIVKAIKNRNPISFFYNGPRKKKKDSVKPGRRIKAEVVAMGLSKKGNLVVRAWVEPPSVSKSGFEKGNWRTFMASRMGSLIIHDDETFENKRPGYKEGDDKSMSVTYVTSDWTKRPEPKKKETKPKKTEPAKKEVPKEPKPKIPKKEVPKPEKEPEAPKEKLPVPEPDKKPEAPINKEPETPEKIEPELKQPEKKEKPLSLSDIGKEVAGDEDQEDIENK
jgi:hypothetical protein